MKPQPRPPWRAALASIPSAKIWLRQHAHALRETVLGFVHTPLATLMTVAVIGVTLALPAGLYASIANLQHLAAGWEGPGRVSLFLKESVAISDAERLAARLRRDSRIARVELITPDQALAEFRRHTDFDEALKALGRNPLPAVLVVHPAASHQQPQTIAALAQELGRLREADQAIVDLEWVERLRGWLSIAERAVWLLAGLLAAAVLLITGNTIRLAVLNRRDEIAVVKLVGGTDAFIRRPFLYAGTFQGLLGGLAAWGLVELAALAMDDPVRELTRLYRSDFALSGLGLDVGLTLLGAAAALGWIGSRLAVSGRLRAIEPA
jgi:cell division transport system permease protein